MTRFWWLRHAPTGAAGMIGWTDPPAVLDRAALARVAACLPARAVVVSSDLWRAVATADAVQGARDRLPHDPRLREIHFGAWEGRDAAAVDGPAARAFWDGSGPAPGGEGWRDLCARVGAATDELARAGHAEVVVVAHHGPILAALQRARGCTPREALAVRLTHLGLTEMAVGPSGWTVGRVDRAA